MVSNNDEGIVRRRSKFSGVAAVMAGLGVLGLSTVTSSTTTTAGILLAVGACFGVLELKKVRSLWGTFSLTFVASAATVILWPHFAFSSDLSYAFSGILFIVFGLANLFGLSAAIQSFYDLGASVGKK